MYAAAYCRTRFFFEEMNLSLPKNDCIYGTGFLNTQKGSERRG